MGRIPKIEKEMAKETILRNSDRDILLPTSDEESIEVDDNSNHNAKNSNKLLNTNLLNEMNIEAVIEQVYECYMNQNSKFFNQIEQANILASLNCKTLKGNDANLKDVWNGIIQLTQVNVKFMVQLIRKLPGLGAINEQEIAIMCNQHLMDFYMVTQYPPKINLK